VGLPELGNLAHLVATWTTSGAGADDPLSGCVRIVHGVTSVVMAAEEAWEESGREVTWQCSGTGAGCGTG